MIDERKPNDRDELNKTFLGMLAHDLVVAIERAKAEQGQTSTRELIRTLFAAIEGIAWTFREHIRSVAESMDELSPLMAMALTEASYSVSENGKLIEQQRYVALPAMIRLTTNLAKSLCPKLDADFGGSGWASLKRAIAIRNRITHPKSLVDLNIDATDAATAWSGLLWLLSHVEHVMRATAVAQTDYLTELRALVPKLLAGDPAALRDYHTAYKALHD
jgi:hypothetical protein